MKVGLAEIICVVDQSGSMDCIKGDAVGSFNKFLADQKNVPGECKFSMTLFNTQYELRYNGIDLKDVPALTEDTYAPNGMTALLDAAGKTIDEVGKRLAETPEDERPERIVFVILTDGMENSSKEYNRDQVKARIERQTNEYKWEFVFLAAGPDAFAESQGLGIRGQNVVQYAAGDAGAHRASVLNVSENVTRYRSGAAPDWSKKGKTQ